MTGRLLRYCITLSRYALYLSRRPLVAARMALFCARHRQLSAQVLHYLRITHFEAESTRVFRDVVQPGMVVLDLGAHVGFYTLLASELVGPRGLVLAFEPEPRNYSMLLENVRSAGATNVRAFACAVSDVDGTAPFNVGPTLGEHSLYVAASQNIRIEVPVVRLDAFLQSQADIPHVDVVKSDIQGAELDALRGMEHTVRENQNIRLLVEWWPIGLRAAGHEPSELLHYLIGLGFAVSEVTTYGCRPVQAEELSDRFSSTATMLYARREAPGSRLPASGRSREARV